MALIAEALEFRYKSGWHLGPVSLRLEGGQILGLIGPNGAGKTTLMRLLAGLILPCKGHISLRDAKPASRLELLHQVRWVPADPAFPQRASLRDMCVFSLRQWHWEEEAIGHFCQKLESLLGRSLRSSPAALSRGQRLLFALELACSVPLQVLLADEPWSSLDPLHRERILQTFTELAQKGVTILVSSHDLLALPTLTSAFCFLAGGQVRWQGTAEDLAGTSASWPEVSQRLYALYREMVGGGAS
jgi:ABC-type multidrug transport system ATPase subunit